jgi:murein DD-endopeptidase MepM/ murein hydrolase activator NlpD
MKGMGRPRSISVGIAITAILLLGPSAARASGSWSWPVVGPVLRAFDAPRTAFGSGHRGIDIACRIGTPILAAASGTVTFAGSVGGQRYVTVTHADGRQSTASWVDAVLVRRNDAVVAGQALATCGFGHVGALIPHVHFGVRMPDGTYVDPLVVLAPPRLSSFLRLAPR